VEVDERDEKDEAKKKVYYYFCEATEARTQPFYQLN